jgi:hypothetical protein
MPTSLVHRALEVRLERSHADFRGHKWFLVLLQGRLVLDATPKEGWCDTIPADEPER